MGALLFRRVNVEITNRCNGHCGFCPGSGPLARQPRSMSVDEFRNITRQLGGLTNEIVPHVLGEPLLHPGFGELLAVAKDLRMPINIVTNGTLWDDQRLKWLLDPAVRQVSISLQARPDGSNMEFVLEFCRQAQRDRPDLFVNLRLWILPDSGSRHVAAEPAVRDALTREWGMDWDLLTVDVRRRKNVPLRGRHYLHVDTAFAWPDLSHPEVQSQGFCHGLTGHFGILSDGTVVPCCLDHAGSTSLGNVFKASIEEILKSPRAKSIREGFALGQLMEPLCRRCVFIQRFHRRCRS